MCLKILIWILLQEQIWKLKKKNPKNAAGVDLNKNFFKKKNVLDQSDVGLFKEYFPNDPPEMEIFKGDFF